MFSPLLRLCPPARCESGLLCGDLHNSARTAIRSRLCGPNTVSPLPVLHLFCGNTFFYCARALLLSARAWRRRVSLKTRYAPPVRSKHASTHPILECFFVILLDKITGLLHLGLALLRLSHTWPFSARNAIRSCLCSPVTLLSLPILQFFRENALSYCARALLFCAQTLLRRISLERRSAYACAVQTHFRPCRFGVCFKHLSLKCTGLLRLGLLRLSSALPFSVRNTIRARLCCPSTLSSLPSLQFFRESGLS